MPTLTRVSVVALVPGFVSLIGVGAPTLTAGAVTDPTFYVNVSAVVHPGTTVTDCASSTNSDCALDDAVAAFNADTTPGDTDTIRFSSSITTFTTSGAEIANITSGLTLDIIGNGPSETVLSGSGQNLVFLTETDPITISNLTIEDGTNVNGDGDAGGIFEESGALTVTNDVFTHDLAPGTGNSGNGGGIFTESGTLFASNDTFSFDAANNEGGAIYSSGEGITATNDTFSDDLSTNGGGAIYNAENTASTSGDTFSGDSASSGGGIFGDGGAILANSDAFSDDSASSDGGGIAFDDSGLVTATSDAFTNDTADADGGGISGGGGTLTATSDTFSGDTAENGGAFDVDLTEITATNDTFANDTADTDGGGIFTNDGAGSFTNDTFSSDSASSGAGIFAIGNGTFVANSILYNAGCSGPIGDNGFNVESDDSCQLGVDESDVVNSSSINLATTLAANGSSGAETLAIGPTSSAFEEVPAGSCTITNDERGDPRPGQLGQSACDAGAYEFQAAAIVTPPAPTVYSSQTIDFAPLSSSPLTMTSSFDLSATATSGLPVTFTSTTTSVCTVSGATVTVLAIGTCSITASQAGDSVFAAAPSVTESFSVTAAPATLPGRAVIRATSPFKGRLRISMSTPSSGASAYQYSLDGGIWKTLTGSGVVTLAGLKPVTYSVRLRGANVAGDGTPSNAVRVRVRS